MLLVYPPPPSPLPACRIAVSQPLCEPLSVSVSLSRSLSFCYVSSSVSVSRSVMCLLLSVSVCVCLPACLSVSSFSFSLSLARSLYYVSSSVSISLSPVLLPSVSLSCFLLSVCLSLFPDIALFFLSVYLPLSVVFLSTSAHLRSSLCPSVFLFVSFFQASLFVFHSPSLFSVCYMCLSPLSLSLCHISLVSCHHHHHHPSPAAGLFVGVHCTCLQRQVQCPLSSTGCGS